MTSYLEHNLKNQRRNSAKFTLKQLSRAASGHFKHLEKGLRESQRRPFPRIYAQYWNTVPRILRRECIIFNMYYFALQYVLFSLHFARTLLNLVEF